MNLPYPVHPQQNCPNGHWAWRYRTSNEWQNGVIEDVFECLICHAVHEERYNPPNFENGADEYGGNPEMEIPAYEDNNGAAGNPDLPAVSGNRP